MMNRFFGQARLWIGKVKQFFLKQSNVGKVLIVGFLFIGVPVSGFLLLFILVWSGLLGELPDRQALQSVQNPVATEIYSADSVLLGKYFIQERSDIAFESIPKHVVNAVLATEDVRFYKHSGIDVRSFLRVFVKSILMGQESSGGGSTITQQLAKNLFPRREYHFLSLPVNKIREVIVASRLEEIYEKDALITLYLNTIPFGDNTFGIETASQRFFSVPTSKLSVEQGAVLVGMLKATYTYNPRIFPARAKGRRDVVIAQMAKYGMLQNAAADSLQVLPLKLDYNKITHHEGSAPYFRSYLREELTAWCKTHTKENGEPFNLYSDGLKIYTTVDSRLQAYAESAVRTQMAIIQEKFQRHWGKRSPWHDRPSVLKDAVKRSDRYRKLKARGVPDEEIDKIMKTPVLMSIFTWQGEEETTMSPLDSIQHYLRFLNAGVLAMDPHDGAVRVWVGGIKHHYFQYDHVRQSTRRQVGSTFKPIVYAAALENGVAPCDYISAEKIIYSDMEEWTPTNSGEENYELKYSMAGGLAYSVNTVSVKVLEKAGIGRAIAVAKRMGIESEMPAVPSLALGVADVSVMEMVTAYTAFANKGMVVKPHYLTAIVSADGKVLETFQGPKPTQAISPETALLMLEMLKGTIDHGTGARLRSQFGVTSPVAGKTGTTQSNADGWFMAVMPDLVIGAWVGADDPRIHFRSTALGQGASTALPIVGSFLQQAGKDPAANALFRKQFPPLPNALAEKLSCDLYKSDETFLESIFGKREKVSRRAFGEIDEKEEAESTASSANKRPAEKKKKKGFLKRLFGRN